MGNKETSCVTVKIYFTFILTLSIFTQFSYGTFVVFFDLRIQQQAEKKTPKLCETGPTEINHYSQISKRRFLDTSRKEKCWL